MYLLVAANARIKKSICAFAAFFDTPVPTLRKSKGRRRHEGRKFH